MTEPFLKQLRSDDKRLACLHDERLNRIKTSTSTRAENTGTTTALVKRCFETRHLEKAKLQTPQITKLGGHGSHGISIVEGRQSH